VNKGPLRGFIHAHAAFCAAVNDLSHFVMLHYGPNIAIIWEPRGNNPYATTHRSAGHHTRRRTTRPARNLAGCIHTSSALYSCNRYSPAIAVNRLGGIKLRPFYPKSNQPAGIRPTPTLSTTNR
jgi:hypothetical protein